MKKVFIVLIVLFLSQTSKAQQDPQFTHFMFDKLSINPGFAGTSDAYCVTGIFRNQWTGFGGSPRTVLLNAHAPIEAIKGGLGFTYFSDKLGFENNSLARLSYSYHLKNLGPGNLGLGFSAGYFTKTYNATWITPDGTPAATDASIPNPTASEGILDFSFGAYYYADNFYGGISATHLSESDITTLNVKTSRHFYLMGGYKYNLTSDLALKPNLLVKSDLVSTQLDANITVIFKETFWGGLTYRLGDAISPIVGMQKEIGTGILKFGISYDVTTSQIKNYSSGTYELMVNYCFNLSSNKPFQRSVHPRFL
jgi:type IX secretion system PorP/SprF family membrane protein